MVDKLLSVGDLQPPGFFCPLLMMIRLGLSLAIIHAPCLSCYLLFLLLKKSRFTFMYTHRVARL